MEEEDEIEAAAQAHKLARVEEIPTTNNNHHHLWPSSRIVRVSRASGGKDRHSKVMTSKGLRDRRVRLSVATAIQFYDLQDRLGVDQPSKAVEWLINAAADAISELPSLNNNFAFNGDEITNNYQHQKKQKQKKKEKEKDVTTVSVSASKSGCSSTSETSRGSGLTLSRNEIRVKARERARERAAKEKETASFTEMLTREINGCDEAPNLLNFNSVTGVSVSPFNDQNFSFMSDSQDYNMLNFSICSSTTSSSGYNSNNRGTLQSNCSLLPPPHMQRFQLQQPFEGSSSSANSTHNFPFLVGSAIPSAAMENHHHHLQFSPLFDARLQLSHSDHKPKPKH